MAGTSETPNSSPLQKARSTKLKACKIDVEAGTTLNVVMRPVPDGFDEDDDRLLNRSLQARHGDASKQAPRGNDWPCL